MRSKKKIKLFIIFFKVKYQFYGYFYLSIHFFFSSNAWIGFFNLIDCNNPHAVIFFYFKKKFAL